METMKIIASKGNGHVGGSLSIADVLAVLYGEVMKYDPQDPNWKERDWLVRMPHAAMLKHINRKKRNNFIKNLTSLQIVIKFVVYVTSLCYIYPWGKLAQTFLCGELKNECYTA